MSRLEIQSFLEFAHHYFNFIGSCNTTNKPTLLGKIVGVYRVKYRTSSSSITSQSNLLVIENLFSGRNIARKFDLKGSVRNRLVDPDVSHEGELVLLDENLINSKYNFLYSFGFILFIKFNRHLLVRFS